MYIIKEQGLKFMHKVKAPAFFIGHGSPMNAILKNNFTASLTELGKKLEKPKAILIVSAHWTTYNSAVSVHSSTDLIYDMYGFPSELYELKYPAKNANFLTPDIQNIFMDLEVVDRGLDHGTWSVLLHLFPDASIPVMQLAINTSLSMQEHFEVGEKIAHLRDMGVMIIGSGNVTHNLSKINLNVDAPVVKWAEEFDEFIKQALLKRDFNSLIDIEKLNQNTRLAHPSLEHYVPLLYVAGASSNKDKSSFIYENFEHSSLSMRSWLLA